MERRIRSFRKRSLGYEKSVGRRDRLSVPSAEGWTHQSRPSLCMRPSAIGMSQSCI